MIHRSTGLLLTFGMAVSHAFLSRRTCHHHSHSLSLSSSPSGLVVSNDTMQQHSVPAPAFVASAAKSRPLRSLHISQAESPSLPSANVHTFPSLLECVEFLQTLETFDDNVPGGEVVASMEESTSPIVPRHLFVVQYVAAYCKVCQRASMGYKKLAHDYFKSQQRQQPSSTISPSAPVVHFLRVEAGSNPAYGPHLRAMGLTKFPFCQIFRDGDGACVASFSAGRGGPAATVFVRRVQGTLEACLQRSSEEWAQWNAEFEADVNENQQGRQRALEGLRQLRDDQLLQQQQEQEADTSGPKP